MASTNTFEFASIGLDDDAWKPLPRDEARSLLCIFSSSDDESRALGAVLVPTPNGKQLYITPAIGAF